MVDATALERNLFFTLQLLELGLPMVIALNQVDRAARRGIHLDSVTLGERLGLPVVRTVGTSGSGLEELAEAIAGPGGPGLPTGRPRYEPAIEAALERLASALDGVEQPYPVRWAALKLLEGDGELLRFFETALPPLVGRAVDERTALEARYGERIGTVISAQRYRQAEEIASAVQERGPGTPRIADRIDRVALHPVLGYVMIAAVLGGLLAWTFIIGAGLSEPPGESVRSVRSARYGRAGSPSHAPLERRLRRPRCRGHARGPLRAAVLPAPGRDRGLRVPDPDLGDARPRDASPRAPWQGDHTADHGYGCSVPACGACRIMETGRQKLISAVLSTLVPCSARTVVILGLVAVTVGVWWALALYLFDLILIAVVGQIAARVVPGTSTGLVMEMPDYHVPSLRVALAQTWARTRSLFVVVFPAYVIGSALLQVAYSAGWLDQISGLLAPVTTGWLGLPAVAGVVLLAGMVRKELTILMLAVIMGTTDMATVLTPVQLDAYSHSSR